jgi:hypothetical protein
VALPLTVCSYPKGGTFTTKLNLKNECLFNHKTVFGTRNPAFWVGSVIASVFFFVRLFVGYFGRAVGQTYSLPSFGLSFGWCDLAMCVAVRHWH